MPRRAIWHGDNDEALALLHAIDQHCTCRPNAGRMITACSSHRMLAHDQRAIDGLLFMRHMAARLLAEEFDLAGRPAAAAPR